jgi:hypothetical protein
MIEENMSNRNGFIASDLIYSFVLRTLAIENRFIASGLIYSFVVND